MELLRHGRRRVVALLTFAFACGALAVASPAAVADPTYPAPTLVVSAATYESFGDPAIAVAPNDVATIVYRYSSFVNDAGHGHNQSPTLRAVRVAADGSVGLPENIVGPSFSIRDIDAAADSDGNTVIVWTRQVTTDQTTTRVEYARLDSDGTLSVPAAQLTATGAVGSTPRVAVDSLDRAHVAWLENGGAGARIRTAMIGADGAIAVPQHYVSAAGAAEDGPQLAIDGEDAVTIAWRRGATIESIRRDAGGMGDHTVATVASSLHSLTSPFVAAGPDGRSTVVWTQRDSFGADLTVRTRRLAADGTPLGSVQTLSAVGASSGAPRVVIDGNNRSVFVWQRVDLPDLPTGQLKSRRMLADGSLEPVLHLSPSGVPAGEHALAIDSSNRAVVTWVAGDLSDDQVRIPKAIRLGYDGLVDGVTATVGESAVRNPVVAIAGGDDPVLAWSRRIYSVNGDGDTTWTTRIEVVRGATTPDPGDPGDGDPGDGDGDPGDADPDNGDPGDGGAGGGDTAGSGPRPADPLPGGPLGPMGPAGPLPPPPPPLVASPATPTLEAVTRGARRVGAPLKLVVVSDTDGSVVASGRQVVKLAAGRRASAARRTTFRLKLRRVHKSVRAGQRVRLKLKPASRRQARKLRRVMRRKRGVAAATVRLVFRDRAGNRSVERLRLKLR